ncbi:MAG: hypothetical protein ATN36_04060 [Epulopiscium sp. Nele67-Bin005]|nr:MAG: hypothetical protein ATN36_04060 [Epulopiscium sp. Nele67-Bin005]
MIKISFYFKDDNLYRFKVKGHSGFSEHGTDIVCAGVSTLVLNTINSIDAFLEEPIELDEVNQAKGIIDCNLPARFNGNYNDQTSILLKSMIFGLTTLEQMYGEYIFIKHIEK